MAFVNEGLQFWHVGERHPYKICRSNQVEQEDGTTRWVTTCYDCEIVCVGQAGYYASWDVVEGSQSEKYDHLGYDAKGVNRTQAILSRRMRSNPEKFTSHDLYLAGLPPTHPTTKGTR
jgi:hypothetical protein